MMRLFVRGSKVEALRHRSPRPGRSRSVAFERTGRLRLRRLLADGGGKFPPPRWPLQGSESRLTVW